MNAPNDIRRQVEAQIIRTIAEAQAAGLGDGVDAARRGYPGTPESVLYGCWAELDAQQEEAWWQQIERTIDGELIRNAIVVTASDPAEAGPRDAHLDEAFAAITTPNGMGGS